jgi:hypothetical protein
VSLELGVVVVLDENAQLGPAAGPRLQAVLHRRHCVALPDLVCSLLVACHASSW